jgi:hypothetical protein
MSDITELREHLFATLRALRDKESPMEIDRARVISQVAATVIDSARAEIEHMRLTGDHTGTGFLPRPEPEALPAGITGVRRHLLKG